MKLVAAPARAFLPVLIAYLVAGIVAWGTLQFLPAWHPLLRVLAADVAATVVIFIFSRLYDNSSFYDAYWMLAPPVIMAYLAFGPGAGGNATRQWLILVLISAWALRLTWNWLRSWEGLGHEDWRYTHFRGQWGGWYWLGSFGAIHMFPTAMTYLGSLPLWSAAANPASLAAADLVAAAVVALAIAIEAISDAQLRSFRSDCETKGVRGGICDRGLWRFSRHPNYFGECLFWLGLWTFGAASSPAAAWWTAAGFVAITAMFVFGTIPMMENRSKERRPEFAAHQKRVSMLVPWLPGKA